jgi:hypothetical protein
MARFGEHPQTVGLLRGRDIQQTASTGSKQAASTGDVLQLLARDALQSAVQGQKDLAKQHYSQRAKRPSALEAPVGTSPVKRPFAERPKNGATVGMMVRKF